MTNAKVKLFLGVFAIFTTFAIQANDRVPSSVIKQIRHNHAKELMGDSTGLTAINSKIKKKDIQDEMVHIIRGVLSKKQKHYAYEITRTIINESMRYKFDPMFLAAVIQNESSFNVFARGTSGEIGLMQIMPKTGEWLAKKYKVKWKGKKMLDNPTLNIRIGAAYLNELREKYNGNGQLYLAAYNMGSANVRSALKKNIKPVDYPRAVMKRYVALYKNN